MPSRASQGAVLLLIFLLAAPVAYWAHSFGTPNVVGPWLRALEADFMGRVSDHPKTSPGRSGANGEVDLSTGGMRIALADERLFLDGVKGPRLDQRGPGAPQNLPNGEPMPSNVRIADGTLSDSDGLSGSLEAAAVARAEPAAAQPSDTSGRARLAEIPALPRPHPQDMASREAQDAARQANQGPSFARVAIPDDWAADTVETTTGQLEPTVVEMPPLDGLDNAAGLTTSKPRAVTTEQRCLAEVMYHEARDEPIRAQLGIAQVVLNRVASTIYPDSICKVTYQRSSPRAGCQFRFACDSPGTPDLDDHKWSTALDLANDAMTRKLELGEIDAATHFHRATVSPRWRRHTTRLGRVGMLVFYRANFMDRSTPDASTSSAISDATSRR